MDKYAKKKKYFTVHNKNLEYHIKPTFPARW